MIYSYYLVKLEFTDMSEHENQCHSQTGMVTPIFGEKNYLKYLGKTLVKFDHNNY